MEEHFDNVPCCGLSGAFKVNSLVAFWKHNKLSLFLTYIPDTQDTAKLGLALNTSAALRRSKCLFLIFDVVCLLSRIRWSP